VSAYRGANAETGRLGEFIEAVRGGAIPRGSWLLIESMDRLSRAKAVGAVRLLETICEEGITVVTLSDGRVYTEEALDDDPMAFMWAFMVAMRANEESLTKSLRLKKAWESKRRQAKETGHIQTTRVPTWLEVHGTKRRRFAVVEEKAEIVRRIFRMTLDAHGQHAIAETLNRGRWWLRSGGVSSGTELLCASYSPRKQSSARMCPTLLR
jgi:DNA invertase Pin-like site-specific DNA recombinase